MITASYRRVSTQEQVESGLGLEAQQERILSYAEFAGLEVVRDFCDNGKSGSIALFDRPEGRQLKELVDSGEVENVIALKIDRLFRDTTDALLTLDYLTNKGVALHFADLGGAAFRTDTAVGRLMFTTLASMAEFERRLTSERTTAALQAKRARGEKLGHASRFNPEQIEQMRTLRASGMTVTAIAKKFVASKQRVSVLLKEAI
jgi:DNA invertase Pin-like site-specific DNA recombinase